MLGELEHLRFLTTGTAREEVLDHPHRTLMVEDHVREEELVERLTAGALELGELLGSQHPGHRLVMVGVLGGNGLAACLEPRRQLGDLLDLRDRHSIGHQGQVVVRRALVDHRRHHQGLAAVRDHRLRQMHFASYYKLPVPQTSQENCVAHNASLVPVPGRDILVQAWYQGGVSVVDFTDSANPTEIAFFDRGPINTPNPTGLNLGGLWSTNWYNATIYGSEIARGFDTFGLLASDQLSANEIAAASEVHVAEFNAQHQTPIVWTPSFNVVRAHFDQLLRTGELSTIQADRIAKDIAKAEEKLGQGNNRPTIAHLRDAARRVGTDTPLGMALFALADTIRG